MYPHGLEVLWTKSWSTKSEDHCNGIWEHRVCYCPHCHSHSDKNTIGLVMEFILMWQNSNAVVYASSTLWVLVGDQEEVFTLLHVLLVDLCGMTWNLHGSTQIPSRKWNPILPVSWPLQSVRIHMDSEWKPLGQFWVEINLHGLGLVLVHAGPTQTGRTGIGSFKNVCPGENHTLKYY